ncbi:YitT family protein [Paenibacillus thermoaerophilus]|uniref:YitT family protein n=1 Tax=Paenibacillus thermoaerophilus TaxID=1215385 RepID=A0ABW2VAN0_9BACL|nr:YitT family protein [Paenibacillus thermoaerophilus]TMV17852.1 YitT family protein [Paenibacillus thermoaerophilus]
MNGNPKSGSGALSGVLKYVRHIRDTAIVSLGALAISAGFNLFLIPQQLLSGGVSGIAMIVGYYTGFEIPILYLVLNLPILIWGLVSIGRRFVALSIWSVALTTWLMQLLPVPSGASIDPVLASVFGGVLVGAGTGYSLRFGGSSGGFDILGSILTRRLDFPLGMVIFALNGIVVLALGYLYGWGLALYSMLSIYITGKIVDMIHIRHIKVTAFIVTSRTKEIAERLLNIPRGVTVISTRGAFSNTERDMLMTVTTRYELADLRRIIREVDPRAFVNIVETVEVLGEFRRTRSP